MRKVYINGRFLTQPASGVQRYAAEVVRALDTHLGTDASPIGQLDVELLVPKGDRAGMALRHLRLREVGRLKGHAWEQLELFAAARDGVLVNLANSGPLLHRRSILVLHDAAIFRFPENFSPSYRAFHRLIRPQLAQRAAKLVTISEFSRRELARTCGVGEEAFTIIGDSAEHIWAVETDISILARHGLSPKRYALTVGNQAPNKNVALALRSFAQAAPEGWLLAVAGGGSKDIFGEATRTDNLSVRKLGRVTDQELRALYENAGVFLFPSRYEGFGVPPLEAMALGCPVISSDAASMPEVLGDAAVYFRSDDEQALAAAITQVVSSHWRREELTERGRTQANLYTWDKSARKFADLICSLSE
jgi:glycosyltransferase involved in cell wall biosynthesis